MSDKPILSFSNATLKKLKVFFDIDLRLEEMVFEKWFSFSYSISTEEKKTLDQLIQTHRLKLPLYQEEKLKAKFISPVLNLVQFYSGELDDWYETEMSHEFDHVILKGITGFLVAKGTDIPEIPYFYLQEFKYSLPDKDPKYQLLAEMIAAIGQNNSSEIKGCYVIGQLWYFTLLKKVDHTYHYYISPSFDALVPEKLQHIFSNLQAVKAEALAFLSNVKISSI